MIFRLLFAVSLSTAGCDYSLKSDYDVTKEYRDFVAAQKEVKKDDLKESVADSQLDLGKKKYETFCVSCHGADGKAQGPAAMAMQPRPRNFTDKAWQKSVDDRG